MSFLLWIAIAIGLVVLAALALPVKIDLALRSDPVPYMHVSTRFFGGITPPLRLSAPKTDLRTTKPKVPRKSTTKGRWGAFPSAAVAFLTDLMRVVHLEHVHVDGRFGLGDPAETGQLYGRLTPLIYGTSGLPRVSIALSPNWGEAKLSGTVDTGLRVVPLALCLPILRFVWRVFGPAR